MYPISGTPVGYQQITSLGAAVGLTIPAGATQALISVSTQIVRLRSDGTDPTTAVGFPIKVGDQIMFFGNLSAIKIIAAVGGAVVDVLYFK